MGAVNKKQADKVLRVSFGWLLITMFFVVVMGMLGGWLAGKIWMPLAPLTIEDGGQVVTTTQEVIISPNLSVAKVLERVERSVVMIGKKSERATFLLSATGVVITNDGLIVTAGDVPRSQLVAYDTGGKEMDVDYVGADELFGLTYLRIKEGVLSPIDMRAEQVPVGHELMAVSRNVTTLMPRTEFFRVNEYILPPELMPSGRQQILRGTIFNDFVLVGSPLIDEEGRLGGMIVNPEAGLGLPINQLKESIQRLTEGAREFDPFRELGFDIHYSFTEIEGTAERQFVGTILAVKAGLPAAEAGLKQGDIIVGAAGQSLNWNDSFVEIASKEMPLLLEIIRGGKRLEVTIEKTGE